MRRAGHLWVIALALAGCASVPLDLPKPSSVALTDNSSTHFGQLAEGWAQLNHGQSGFYPFVRGLDALGARLEMAGQAEETLDLQYFLMKDDAAGYVVATALWRAAERGVRVRFLLDDVFTTAPDSGLLYLDAHPNIEVRLFNPISRRGLHSLNFISHFRRANRRMHNKSFIVDNAIAVVGGRNIADEYFQLKNDAVFADFDVLAFGPVVRDVSASFDKYWNHSLAVPMEQLASKRAKEKAKTPPTNPEYNTESVYARAVGTDLLRQLGAGEVTLYPAPARVLADDPGKLQNAVGREYMQLAAELGALLQDAEREVLFITPYYVPRDYGVDFVRDSVEKGVRVVVVTNSLASNNHIPVHSAYSGYRKDVLRAGAELYEVRANAGRASQGDGAPEHLTLHTKMIVIDRRYLFVGSLNLDPRSIEINAEMGLVIDSPELAGLIAEGLGQALKRTTYQVVRNAKGRLEWRSAADGVNPVETSEPLSSPWRRFKAWLLKIVPDSQL
ncbi:MAG: phospholipase D family protein [Pseudomonadota bacterium]